MNLKELIQEKFSENRLNKKNMSTVTTWPWLLTTRLLLTFVRSCTCLRREFFGFLNWNYLAVMRPCDEFSAHCQSWFRAVLGIFLAMTIFFLSTGVKPKGHRKARDDQNQTSLLLNMHSEFGTFVYVITLAYVNLAVPSSLSLAET